MTNAMPRPGAAHFQPPAVPERLVGRADDIAMLVSHLDSADVGLCVLYGPGGVGKTALAIRVAELTRDRYPDGFLYVDLQGCRPSSQPLDEAEVLDRVLRGLGIPGQLVRQGLDNRAGAFRNQLSNRRMLLVLDDVVDHRQIRLLVPPNTISTVLAVSRERLSGLMGAVRQPLVSLSEARSAELFRVVAGSDSQSTVDGGRERPGPVIAICGGLPLGIRIVAALFRRRPPGLLEDFAQRFSESLRSGATSTADDVALTALIATSCFYLTEDQHRVLALCALHPGGRLDANSAAALTGTSPDEAGRHLNILLGTGMLERCSPRTYQLHAVLHEHLWREWSEVLSKRQRRAAWTWLFDYYLRTAAAADAVIAEHRFRCPLSLQPNPRFVLEFPDATSAMDWMSVEVGNFLPLVEEMAALGFHDLCWQFVYCLRGYLFEDKRWAVLRATCLVATGSAHLVGNHWAEANMLNNLGLACCEQGESGSEAADYFTRARKEFRVAGDQYGEMNVVANFSWLRYYEGNYDAALHLGLTALSFYRSREMEWNAAIALDGVARAELKLDRLEEAHAHFCEALTEFERLKFAPVHLAQVYTRLGRTEVALGDSQGAVGRYERAIENARKKPLSRYDEAVALEELGGVLTSLGRDAEAAAHLESAMRLYEAVGAPEADRLPGRVPSRYTQPPSTRGGVRILSVNTEWSSSQGGLSTFNRRLCGALAHVGAEVICLVGEASEADRANATAAGVRLVKARHTAVGDARSPRPELPTGVTIDVVIGHGRVTGRQARQLVADHYPTAKRFHFFHVASDEVEFDKENRSGDAMEQAEQRTTLELELACSASRAVAVGPRLYERLRLGMTGIVGARDPIRLDPGFDIADTAQRSPVHGRLVQILILGRLDRRESTVKGLDLAAKALAHAMELRESGEPEIELVVRGVPEGEGDRLREQVQQWAGNPLLRVLPRSYSTDADVMAQDLRRAALVVMPSRTEGFGLAGLEAIVAGTPVLVSGSSGLGMLLREVLPTELANQVVVPIHRTEARDVPRWGHAIAMVLGNPSAAFQTAEAVRQRMADKRTWTMAAKRFLNTVRETAY